VFDGVDAEFVEQCDEIEEQDASDAWILAAVGVSVQDAFAKDSVERFIAIQADGVFRWRGCCDGETSLHQSEECRVRGGKYGDRVRLGREGWKIC